MEDSAVGRTSVGSSGEPPIETTATPWQPPRSRADRSAEDLVIVHVRRGDRDQALRLLMRLYGPALTSFALRVVRDRELAKDIRQQVFLEAFQGIARFEGRSSVWSWLCGIAYHRCLDELRRRKRMGAVDSLDVLDLLESTGPELDANRVAERSALDKCIGSLVPDLRTQVLMRYFFGLSYVEIGDAVGDAPGTVQVRISRILPRLQQCLRSKGVVR